MNNILSIKNLEKTYHTEHGEINAISNITFDVKEGEFVVIVGPSGCGKSTLLSVLANIDSSSKGTIKFNKENPKIGYMLQQDALFPWLSILDNTLLGQKIIKEENKDYVISLLDTYGLKEFINKKPHELSGGMRQRVALIRTLAINPDILLLDEPFGALDYQTRLNVSEDVYNIIKKENKTTIMVTHDLAEAISLADRIIVLSKRPSKIKKEYLIKMENKSTPINNRKQKEFMQYYEKIWRDLDMNVKRAN